MAIQFDTNHRESKQHLQPRAAIEGLWVSVILFCSFAPPASVRNLSRRWLKLGFKMRILSFTSMLISMGNLDTDDRN